MSGELAGRVDAFNCSHLPYGWTVSAPICRTCVLALVQREVAAERERVAVEVETMKLYASNILSAAAGANELRGQIVAAIRAEEPRDG